MIYKLVASFVFVLHFTPTLGSPRPRRHNYEHNLWEIEQFSLQRWNRTGFPAVGAEFSLYRSYHVPCNLPGDGLFALLLAGETCGYFVPDNPVACKDGIKTYSDDPDNIW